ncbi:DUF4142 domain-containing protein [Melittangium boletus]|nr:DUF4142 domain-containing protein [Melittangium boletus]
MKRMMKGFVVAGALVVGSTAFAAEKATAHKGFVVPSDEKALLERLHYANQQEIKQGELAQQNSQNPDVKAFAEQMVRQHTEADQKLLAYTQTKKVKLTDTPKPMDDAEKKAMAADKANLENLRVLKGEAFDSAYLAGQLGAHDAVLGKLAAGNQAIDGDPQLGALITEVTKNVAQHRQHVYALLGKTGPEGAVGGAGASGTNMGTPAPAPAQPAPAPAPTQPRK